MLRFRNCSDSPSDRESFRSVGPLFFVVGEVLVPASCSFSFGDWHNHGYDFPASSMRSFLKCWLPLLTWMAIIFAASGDSMSSAHTSRFLVPFLLWLKEGMSPETIW